MKHPGAQQLSFYPGSTDFIDWEDSAAQTLPSGAT